MDFDIATHVDESGNFTEQLATDLPEIMGPDFKGGDMSQFIGTNIGTLLKNGISTKQAFNSKLENVIQKPGEDATPEQLAEYQAACKEAAGITVPKDATGYEFNRPEMPEGLTYKEESETAFKEFCLENGVDASTASLMYDMHMGNLLAEHNAAVQAADDAFKEQSASLTTDWPGEKLGLNLRQAHDALAAFGGDDMVAALKEADMYKDPTDLQKWRDLGLTPDQLRTWQNIGSRMQAGTGASTPSIGMSEADRDRAAHVAFVNKVNANSPSLQIK